MKDLMQILDEPLPELDGLSRREFASKWNVDPRYVAIAPTAPLDEQRRIVADALGVDVRYIPADALTESEGNHA